MILRSDTYLKGNLIRQLDVKSNFRFLNQHIIPQPDCLARDLKSYGAVGQVCLLTFGPIGTCVATLRVTQENRTYKINVCV